MSFLSKNYWVTFVIAVLTGCGGSSGGASSPTKPQPSDIILNASQYSEEELTQAAKSLVSSRYSGFTFVTKMNAVSAQKAYLYLFNDSTLDIPETGNEIFSDLADIDGNVDIDVQCYYQGTVSYKGKIDSNSQGHLSLTYDNCEQLEHDFAISGNVAIVVSELSDTSRNLSYHYDNLQWVVNDNLVSLTGLSNIKANTNTSGQLKAVNQLDILLKIEGVQQFAFNGQTTVNEQLFNIPIDISGDFYIGDEGKVSVSLQNVYNLSPRINSGKVNFVGDKLVSFDFSHLPYIQYSEDSDGDQTYDVATYFSGFSELLNGNASSKLLVNIEDLSLPPYAGRPRKNYNQTFDTNTPVEILAGSYSDPDTLIDELQISYRWYINGDVVDNESSNILPANYAVFGDDLQVSMLVSDGGNIIESDRVSITLADAPASIEIFNLPDVIQSGDTVQFSVQVTDPDSDEIDTPVTLISGPIGGKLENGSEINWTVPTDFLFPMQTYEFSFGIVQEDGSIDSQLSVSVEVQSDKSFPIIRSGIDVPQSNKSMSVGDFDGDGQNEVLSTDSNSSVFLLEYNQGEYRQKWVYPFKVPSDGRIVQVLSANVDQDSQLEILVVTEKGISLINGLDSVATIVLATETNISFAAIKDLQGDGLPEIAFLHSGTSSNNQQLDVISIDSPDISIFTTNVSEAVQIEFSNVDKDSNSELVLNNGLVYDTDTWENQWFSGTKFGNRSVTSGDYNGDGINEIAGANSWGSLTVFDVINKSQIDSFDNFNTCTLHSADVDNDGYEELLVGDCQWGVISAYKLVDNKLQKLWSVDMQDHGSISLTSGDSDNDGKMELHWGTGITHSGEDQFITADIDLEDVSIKETAITSQLDSYSSAGWSKLINDEERAVFFVPSTRSGYGGSKILTLAEDGNFDLSNEISSNWDNSSYAVTTDFNKDGFGDVFLPNTKTYDGSFAAMQLLDNTIHWQITEGYDSNIGLIKAIDFNQDGYDDAIYNDGSLLKAIDVYNQTIIANYKFDSSITDFVALQKSTVSAAVVSSGGKLHYLKLNNGVLSETTFVEQSCSKLALINYDDDAELEVICLQGSSSSYEQQLVIYEIESELLSEVVRKNLTQHVIDICVDPLTLENQNLYMVVQYGDSRSYWDSTNKYHIQKTSSLGQPIWTGPELIGKPTKNGLKVRKTESSLIEIMLSTNQVVYWIK